MTFDEFGNLYMAVFSPETNDIGNISKIQAVEIALSQIQSDKYNFSDFRRFSLFFKKKDEDNGY